MFRDIHIKEVRIIRNCLNKPHEIVDFDENYICVISIFDEIDASSNHNFTIDLIKNITITYEYNAPNILKSTSDSNFAIWKYDNHLQEGSIENVNFTFNFEEDFNATSIEVANTKDFQVVNNLLLSLKTIKILKHLIGK